MQNNIATESFKNGFNCAQAIVSAFGPGMGVSRELSLKLASGLGGGINGQGGMCGAVVGALIVLGLNRGIEDAADRKGKDAYRELANEFSAEFLKKYPSLKCHELLLNEAGSPELFAEMKANNEFRDYCSKVVRSSATILEKMLEE